MTFKDLIDIKKPIKVYGISRNGLNISTRNITIKKTFDPFYRRDCYYLFSYTNKGKRSTCNFLDIGIDLSKNYIKLDNYTYYLDYKIPYNIIINKINQAKRDLNAKQLKLQIELVNHGKNDK